MRHGVKARVALMAKVDAERLKQEAVAVRYEAEAKNGAFGLSLEGGPLRSIVTGENWSKGEGVDVLGYFDRAAATCRNLRFRSKKRCRWWSLKR